MDWGLGGPAFGDKHSLFMKALTLYQREGTAKIIAILESEISMKEAVTKLLRQVASDVFY
jgi:TetR/AcrR family transcriptional repressor of nem operon